MTVKIAGASQAATLAWLLPMAASAQSISSGPPTVANVPVDHPLALGVLVVLLATAAWWTLRRSHGAQRVVSLMLVAACAGLAGHASGLMAQAVSAFTNPAGETLPITVQPITAGGFTGFQPADFSNASGAALRIAAIDPPDLAQCFATNPANTLLPPGPPAASPHPVCGVGAMLPSGAVCRVDVEAICRSLYVSSASLASIGPVSGTASGGAGVILTGTGLAGTTSVTFDGVPATSVNVVNATTIAAVTPAHAPGVVDVVVITPAGAAQLANGYTYLATAVGQSSGGGLIAALDGGITNLIAAAADNNTGIGWGGFGAAVGPAAQSDTDGASNTTGVESTLGAGAYAAQVCSVYEVDSQGNTPCEAGNTCYSDWFLPARNQLAAIFVNRTAVGGFASALYWSSTEFTASPATNAWATDFSIGAPFALPKSQNLRARCVRAFTP